MNRLTVVLAVIVCAFLGGCSTDDAPTQAARVVSVHDAWVKAADQGMTAAFAHLRNDSDQQIRILSATTPVAQRVELHEVVLTARGDEDAAKAGGLRLPPTATWNWRRAQSPDADGSDDEADARLGRRDHGDVR